jgi:hypothetical protein
MRRIFRVCGLAMVTTGILVCALAGAVSAAGPAPNSGDCIPDGSGMVAPHGSGSGGTGPAPNFGDGIPDGSGF